MYSGERYYFACARRKGTCSLVIETEMIFKKIRNQESKSGKQKPERYIFCYLSSVICLLLFLICLLSDAYAAGRRPSRAPNYVRVAVIKDAREITLSIRGPYQIFALHTDQVLSQGSSLHKARISPATSGIKIGELPLKFYGIRVIPEHEASIFIDRQRFRGCIDIIRTEKLSLLVVNHIDVEDYLYGVLYNEVSPWWSMEALKAQAIASRTFALYEKKAREEADYDLTCDIYSQVYRGRTSERYRTTRAVNQTQGLVLTYQGKIFPAYYHATCGGHTEDVSELWDLELPVLKGVSCDFCHASPHYQWKEVVDLRVITRALHKAGYAWADIHSIDIKDRDKSGRIRKMVLVTSEGPVSMSANQFRLAVSPNVIRSANFEVIMDSEYARFSGFGWGHGVGLCQWGASYMARKGYSTERILKHYYPGAKIERLQGY